MGLGCPAPCNEKNPAAWTAPRPSPCCSGSSALAGTVTSCSAWCLRLPRMSSKAIGSRRCRKCGARGADICIVCPVRAVLVEGRPRGGRGHGERRGVPHPGRRVQSESEAALSEAHGCGRAAEGVRRAHRAVAVRFGHTSRRRSDGRPGHNAADILAGLRRRACAARPERDRRARARRSVGISAPYWWSRGIVRFQVRSRISLPSRSSSRL